LPAKNDKLGVDRDEGTDQQMRCRGYNQRKRGGGAGDAAGEGDRRLLVMHYRLAGLSTDRAGRAAAGVLFFLEISKFNHFCGSLTSNNHKFARLSKFNPESRELFDSEVFHHFIGF
jgi:hypothetical protein